MLGRDTFVAQHLDHRGTGILERGKFAPLAIVKIRGDLVEHVDRDLGDVRIVSRQRQTRIVSIAMLSAVLTTPVPVQQTQSL